MKKKLYYVASLMLIIMMGLCLGFMKVEKVQLIFYSIVVIFSFPIFLTYTYVSLVDKKKNSPYAQFYFTLSWFFFLISSLFYAYCMVVANSDAFRMIVASIVYGVSFLFSLVIFAVTFVDKRKQKNN